MIQNKNFKNILELNVALIFMSTTGVLARHIQYSLAVTIASRAIIAGILLFAFCKWKGFNFSIKKKDIGMVLLSGVLLTLHWLTYFYSLRLSNVAIGMISLFTYPIITSFLEPIILKSKFQKSHILLAILVFIGIYFLAPEFDFKNDYTKAIIFGIISAVFFSLRNIITKTKISKYNGSSMMMYQLFIVFICLLPFCLMEKNVDLMAQLPATLALAILPTAIGHTLFLYSFKNFSVTSISIMSCSQPIYGILLGILFLSEFPEYGSIIGGAIILLSVVLESKRNYKAKPIPKTT